MMKGYLIHVFGIPLILAIISLVGLVSALLEDGIWDALSWVTLGLLNLLVLWYWLKPARR